MPAAAGASATVHGGVRGGSSAMPPRVRVRGIEGSRPAEDLRSCLARSRLQQPWQVNSILGRYGPLRRHVMHRTIFDCFDQHVPWYSSKCLLNSSKWARGSPMMAPSWLALFAQQRMVAHRVGGVSSLRGGLIKQSDVDAYRGTDLYLKIKVTEPLNTDVG